MSSKQAYALTRALAVCLTLSVAGIAQAQKSVARAPARGDEAAGLARKPTAIEQELAEALRTWERDFMKSTTQDETGRRVKR